MSLSVDDDDNEADHDDRQYRWYENHPHLLMFLITSSLRFATTQRANAMTPRQKPTKKQSAQSRMVQTMTTPSAFPFMVTGSGGTVNDRR
jgi:hypothetical protein